jgi:AraC-like DNA-binding protein
MAFAFEQVGLAPGKSFRLLEWTDNLTDVVQCYAGGRRSAIAGAGERWHFHPEYELALITKGQGKRFVGDHVSNFAAPDLVLIGPNLPHYWSGLTESSGYILQFVLDAHHPLGQLEEMQSLMPILQESKHGVRLSGDVVNRIARALPEMAERSKLGRLSMFVEVLAELAEVEPSNYERLSRATLSFDAQNQHMAAISQAVGYVFSNFEKGMCLEDLLQVTNMSKPTFSRHFKRHTGRSLTTFLNQVRIVNAKRLLLETNLPITKIAHDSGFHSLSHFNVQFKRSLDESPRAFRKRAIREDTA